MRYFDKDHLTLNSDTNKRVYCLGTDPIECLINELFTLTQGIMVGHLFTPKPGLYLMYIYIKGFSSIETHLNPAFAIVEQKWCSELMKIHQLLSDLIACNIHKS